MDAGKVEELREFVDTCKMDPSMLSDPSLAFFKDYLLSLGAKIPASSTPRGNTRDVPSPRTHYSHAARDDMGEHYSGDFDMKDVEEEHDELDDEIIESDIDFEGEVVEEDDDSPQKMGDSSLEVSEENRDSSQEFKGKAMEAISDGKLNEAVEHLTEAILLNPKSAIMYATRASVYIKMKKPNAARRDADAALEINPDSAKGYKSRGIAFAMLGKWEEAAKDLHLASTIDYDEEIYLWLKKVEPNSHKIEEHRRKYERMHKEREEKKAQKERRRRRAKAQATYDSEKKKEHASGHSSGQAPENVDMSQILNDPELMAALSDPEIMAALQDVMNNPANFIKHQANPKVGPVMTKMMEKFSKNA